jgi:hypothetical protein
MKICTFTSPILSVVLMANLAKSFVTNVEDHHLGKPLVKHHLPRQFERICLRGGVDSNDSEGRKEVDSSVKAFFRGCGILGRLFTLTVIYSADTGSVSLGNVLSLIKERTLQNRFRNIMTYASCIHVIQWIFIPIAML